MKKIKDFAAGIVGLLLIGGILGVDPEKVGSILSGLIIIAAISLVSCLVYFIIKFFIWLSSVGDKKEPPASVSQTEKNIITVTVEDTTASADAALAGKISTSSIDGTGGKLTYDRVGIYRPAGACGPMPKVGQYLSFQLDPKNPYDSEAIRAIYWDNADQLQIAGYMNRTKLREMVRDWIDRDDELDCIVESNDPKLYVTIEFYR